MFSTFLSCNHCNALVIVVAITNKSWNYVGQVDNVNSFHKLEPVLLVLNVTSKTKWDFDYCNSEVTGTSRVFHVLNATSNYCNSKVTAEISISASLHWHLLLLPSLPGCTVAAVDINLLAQKLDRGCS